MKNCLHKFRNIQFDYEEKLRKLFKTLLKLFTTLSWYKVRMICLCITEPTLKWLQLFEWTQKTDHTLTHTQTHSTTNLTHTSHSPTSTHRDGCPSLVYYAVSFFLHYWLLRRPLGLESRASVGSKLANAKKKTIVCINFQFASCRKESARGPLLPGNWPAC